MNTEEFIKKANIKNIIISITIVKLYIIYLE